MPQLDHEYCWRWASGGSVPWDSVGIAAGKSAAAGLPCMVVPAAVRVIEDTFAY